MKIKGFTQIGFITGLLIVLYQLLLIKSGKAEGPLWLVQYAFLYIGIFISIYLYNRTNKLVLGDLFMIGFRTLSMSMLIILLYYIILHVTWTKSQGRSLTEVLMFVVFSYGFSGILSILVSAVINKTLLNKH